MARLKVIAFEEQLEIEKLAAKEESAAKGNEYDVLYDQVTTQQKAEEDQKKISSADDLDGDADAEDTPSEDGEPTEEEGDGEGEDTPAAGEEVSSDPALESFRSMTYSSEEIATEDWDSTKTAIRENVSLLGTLGITFTAAVATHLFKGVIYVFVKLAKLLYISTVAIKRYIERRTSSFAALKEEIQDLRKSVDALKQRGDDVDLEGQKYTNQAVINSLKIANSVAFADNVSHLGEFVAKTITGLSEQVAHENSAITHIVSSSLSNSAQAPSKFMDIASRVSGLSQGVVEGYEPASEYVDAYHSSTVLPGDVVLIAALPKSDLQEFGDITKAYNDSSMILGFNMASHVKVDGVDYMTVDALSGFLDRLEKLCDVCIAHEAVYDKINKNRMSLRILLKNYFNGLVNKSHKVSLKNSFVEYVYLKAMFIDKVYLTACMDIHDYTAKILTAGLRYTKDGVKKLS